MKQVIIKFDVAFGSSFQEECRLEEIINQVRNFAIHHKESHRKNEFDNISMTLDGESILDRVDWIKKNWNDKK